MRNDKMTNLTLLLESFPSTASCKYFQESTLFLSFCHFLNKKSRFVFLSQTRGLTAAQRGRPNILHLGGRVGCLEQAPCPNNNGERK